MNRQDILTLLEYNAWANTRALDACAALSPEELVRDLGNSFPSVRDTLAHILGAEWIWLRRWQGESPTTLLAAAGFPTVASLKDRFAAIDGERRAFVDALAEDRLAQLFVYRDLAGKEHSLLLAHSLQHVVNHGTYHRGQMTHFLRDLQLPAPSTDYLIFLEEQRGED